MTPDEWKLREWLNRAAEGDEEAIEQLWKFFYPRLKAAVRRAIESVPRLVGEESDLTSKALHGFLCKMLRSPDIDLTDVNGVWKLLRVVTMRHINDVAKNRFSQKRGGLVSTTSLDQSVFGAQKLDETDSDGSVFSEELRDPNASDPSQSVLFDDFVEHLLSQLDDEKTRYIVLLRLGGYNNGEIAELMKISIRTIQRRIEEIGKVWTNDQDFRSILGDQN